MDSNAVMLALVIVAAVVGIMMFASKSKKKEIPHYTSPLNDPSYRWRGEKGSSGDPDFQHSSNCECHMCLFHHDPNNRDCKCKVCSDPAAFYGD